MKWYSLQSIRFSPIKKPNQGAIPDGIQNVTRLTGIIHEVHIERHVFSDWSEIDPLVDDWYRYFSRKTRSNADQST